MGLAVRTLGWARKTKGSREAPLALSSLSGNGRSYGGRLWHPYMRRSPTIQLNFSRQLGQPVEHQIEHFMKFVFGHSRDATLVRQQSAHCGRAKLVTNCPRSPTVNCCPEWKSPLIVWLCLRGARNNRHGSMKRVSVGQNNDWSAFPELRQMCVLWKITPEKLTNLRSAEEPWRNFWGRLLRLCVHIFIASTGLQTLTRSASSNRFHRATLPSNIAIH